MPHRRLARALCVTASLVSCAMGLPAQGSAAPLRGVNLVHTENVPLGSTSSRRSLERMRQLGANSVALLPFLYQAHPTRPEISRGNAVTDEQLVAGIRMAHQFGFTVVLKPHIWVPGHWAGQIVMREPDEWRRWFGSYTDAIVHYATLAQREGVAVFSIGVELEQTSRRPEWNALIRRVRAAYRGRITYVAHGMDELPRVPFWSSVDLVGVSLYPALGTDTSTAALRRAIMASATQVQRVAAAAKRPLLVAEVGLRSVNDAQLRPWESPEERVGQPDEVIQARVLALWLDALESRASGGVLVWRWFADPLAGGADDTDFTVQRKLAEGVLLARWRR